MTEQFKSGRRTLAQKAQDPAEFMSPIAEPPLLEHDCEKELIEAGLYPTGFCTDGKEWRCSCGKRYKHVCDEAEGCSWILLRSGSYDHV